MTTANKITILRFLLIPVMMVFIYIPLEEIRFLFFDIRLNQLIFAFIFVFAAITDFVDGYIARKYQQVTTFGKFLDPIADKVLVLTGMLYMMQLDSSKVPLWTIMIVIIREFSVTGIRLLAVEKNIVIAASPYGKIKTVVTMIALIYYLFNGLGIIYAWIGHVLWYSAVALTVISGIDYLIKSKKVIFESV